MVKNAGGLSICNLSLFVCFMSFGEIENVFFQKTKPIDIIPNPSEQLKESLEHRRECFEYFKEWLECRRDNSVQLKKYFECYSKVSVSVRNDSVSIRNSSLSIRNDSTDVQMYSFSNRNNSLEARCILWIFGIILSIFGLIQ